MRCSTSTGGTHTGKKCLGLSGNRIYRLVMLHVMLLSLHILLLLLPQPQLLLLQLLEIDQKQLIVVLLQEVQTDTQG